MDNGLEFSRKTGTESQQRSGSIHAPQRAEPAPQERGGSHQEAAAQPLPFSFLLGRWLKLDQDLSSEASRLVTAVVPIICFDISYPIIKSPSTFSRTPIDWQFMTLSLCTALETHQCFVLIRELSPQNKQILSDKLVCTAHGVFSHKIPCGIQVFNKLKCLRVCLTFV